MYNKRTVRSRPNMTQEQALDSLQQHPMFRPGTKIASIRRRGKVWVADLLEPKTAGDFPGGDEGGSEEPAPKPKAEKKEESPDSGPSEGGDEGGAPDFGGGDDDGGDDIMGFDSPDGGPEGGDEQGGTETAILHTLQQILHALQGGAPEPGLGGPDALGPDAPPAGPHPPHGGPPGGGLGGPPPMGAGKPGSMGIGAKLKPGEIKNGPGAVPVGAPAFSSVNPELRVALAKQASRSATITVTTPTAMKIAAAKDYIEAHAPREYRVVQATYVEGGRVKALLTCR